MVERTLKSGRKVVMREATGLDDILCQQLTGEGVTEESLEKNVLGQITLQMATMAVLCVKEYDGKEMDPPATVDDVLKVAASMPLKDWGAILKIYKEVNGEDEDPAGE